MIDDLHAFKGIALAFVLSLPLWLTACAAFADDTPQVRALSQRLIGEFQNSVNCEARALALQDEIKALKDKYEPKPKKDK